MRPQRQQVFRTDAAAKLDRLELVAALLERDATNNRTLIGELSAARQRPASRLRLVRRWRKFAHAASSVARATVSLTVAVATSPRLHAGLRAIYAFIIDFAVVLGIAVAAVVILTAAFLLEAPPV